MIIKMNIHAAKQFGVRLHRKAPIFLTWLLEMDALRRHFGHNSRRLKAYCLNLHVEGQFDYRLDPNQEKFELLCDRRFLLASTDFGI